VSLPIPLQESIQSSVQEAQHIWSLKNTGSGTKSIFKLYLIQLFT
jgi:hypothetical protein